MMSTEMQSYVVICLNSTGWWAITKSFRHRSTCQHDLYLPPPASSSVLSRPTAILNSCPSKSRSAVGPGRLAQRFQEFRRRARNLNDVAERRPLMAIAILEPPSGALDSRRPTAAAPGLVPFFSRSSLCLRSVLRSADSSFEVMAAIRPAVQLLGKPIDPGNKL